MIWGQSNKADYKDGSEYNGMQLCYFSGTCRSAIAPLLRHWQHTFAIDCRLLYKMIGRFRFS